MKYISAILFFLMIVCNSLCGKDDFTNYNLDTYLQEHDVFVIEGFVTAKQKAGFIQDMQRLSHIKKIMEIGFNAGHSSELFLGTTDCEKLVSFDINIHPYVKIGAEFIQNKYGERFTFIEGDSRIKVPEYTASHPNEKFDLIFIDGGHSLECCLSDILSCRQLAHRETIVLIDDYVAEVKAAVDICLQSGLIILLETKFTNDVYIKNINGGDRIWVIVQYAME